MRALGHDDVIFPAGIHPGLMAFPVALAVGERERISGRAFLTAIVVAYEIMGKFGLWTWSLETPRRAVMLFGPFGAVAVASRALGLSAERTAAALAYAAHTAMGLAEGDGMVTHWYALVCRNGLTGTYMAKAGGWGSPTVMEGRYGFLEAFVGEADSVDPDALIASYGHDYAITRACEKRYPGTALNQLPIELTRALVKEHRLAARDVAAVRLYLPRERENIRSAQFKGPFLTRNHASSTVTFHIAIVMLDGGETRLSRFDELNNPEILALVDRIEIEFVAGKPIRYAQVEIRRRDGSVLSGAGEEFYFEPEPAETILEREAVGILPRSKLTRFLELHAQLENLDDVSPMIKCLGL
jgi:2-methylcitrate dehydratase PrpD